MIKLLKYGYRLCISKLSFAQHVGQLDSFYMIVTCVDLKDWNPFVGIFVTFCGRQAYAKEILHSRSQLF